MLTYLPVTDEVSYNGVINPIQAMDMLGNESLTDIAKYTKRQMVHVEANIDLDLPYGLQCEIMPITLVGDGKDSLAIMTHPTYDNINKIDVHGYAYIDGQWMMVIKRSAVNSRNRKQTYVHNARYKNHSLAGDVVGAALYEPSNGQYWYVFVDASDDKPIPTKLITTVFDNWYEQFLESSKKTQKVTQSELTDNGIRKAHSSGKASRDLTDMPMSLAQKRKLRLTTIDTQTPEIDQQTTETADKVETTVDDENAKNEESNGDLLGYNINPSVSDQDGLALFLDAINADKSARYDNRNAVVKFYNEHGHDIDLWHTENSQQTEKTEPKPVTLVTPQDDTLEANMDIVMRVIDYLEKHDKDKTYLERVGGIGAVVEFLNS